MLIFIINVLLLFLVFTLSVNQNSFFVHHPHSPPHFLLSWVWPSVILYIVPLTKKCTQQEHCRDLGISRCNFWCHDFIHKRFSIQKSLEKECWFYTIIQNGPYVCPECLGSFLETSLSLSYGVRVLYCAVTNIMHLNSCLNWRLSLGDSSVLKLHCSWHSYSHTAYPREWQPLTKFFLCFNQTLTNELSDHRREYLSNSEY